MGRMFTTWSTLRPQLQGVIKHTFPKVGVEAEAIHWPREEVQSLALVQEGDVEALLQHLASTYYEKHGELATEADLKLWGECLRSMRVDCTEVTHASR